MVYEPVDSRAAFESRIAAGQTEESLFLDFKGEYHWQKSKCPDAQKRDREAAELCRDVAQFANTLGGTLLVGLTEHAGQSNRKVAGKVLPVDDIEGFRNWIEQSIHNRLMPSTFSHTVDPIETSQGPIVAINIPPSLHLVALVDPPAMHAIEYVYRTSHGKSYMNPDEVAKHIMNSSRAVQIKLASISDDINKGRIGRTVALTPPVKTRRMENLTHAPVLINAPFPVWFQRLFDHEVELGIKINNTLPCVRIPHEMIHSVWTTSDSQVGLWLKCAIIAHNDELSLEPFSV